MKVYKLLSILVITGLALYLCCSSDINVNMSQSEIPDTGTQIILSANSSTKSLLKISGLSNDTLVIDSGTTILKLDNSNNYVPLSSTSKISITLNSGDTSFSHIPVGMKKVASFGIVATVNGKSSELLFVPPLNKSTKAGMPYTGVHWTAQISDTGIRNGTTLSLYKISSSQNMTLIGSSVVNTPVKVLSKMQQNTQNTAVSPNGTGNYNVTSSYLPALNSTSATMPVSGVYWTQYSSIPDTTFAIGEVIIGGPLFAGLVSIGEPSTEELLADLCFVDGVNCVTYTNKFDNVQYWVERTQNTEGRTTALKVASTAANIPYLNLALYSVETGRPVLFIYGLKPDGNVVHAPDGSVLSNPYEDPSRKIGGSKILHFKVDNYNEGRKTKELFDGTGYDISSFRYNNGIYSFLVSETDDGRALFEDKILEKNSWFPIKNLTTGSVGYYERRDTVILNVTSHPIEEMVSTQKIILKGTIDNPAKKYSPVTDILITYASGPESQLVHATITGDTIFTAELNLFPGDNLIVLVPIGKNTSGEDAAFSKYKLKAQGVETNYLTLTYEASWIGKFEITKKTTTVTREPDTSVSVSITNISADLKMNFKNSKLWYIKKSHEDALSCSGMDNCYLFSGSINGPVSASVSTQTQGKNCEGEMPLITKFKSSGSASLDKYTLNVYATLTPWDDGDVSTDRRYHLSVNAGPHISIHTDSNWPKAVNQSYDCLTESWRPDTIKLGPLLRLDDAELKFTNTAELEDYADSPITAKSWSFTSTRASEDGLTVEEYTATLSIQP